MVDYDIVCMLKNHVGYSSWGDVPFNQKELCYNNYNTKMPLPNWNGNEERYSAGGAIAHIFQILNNGPEGRSLYCSTSTAGRLRDGSSGQI